MTEQSEITRVLVTEEEIAAKVKELGEAISQAYAGIDGPLRFVVILKGAAIFAADLVRAVRIPLTLDFMAISSYGKQTKSSGVVRILKDLDSSIEGAHVLVVEDIVDTGLTLKYLMENLKGRGAASVRACVFLDKPQRRKVEVTPDFVGFIIPDEFAVGYGLDYAERYRNLPYVGALHPRVYQGKE